MSRALWVCVLSICTALLPGPASGEARCAFVDVDVLTASAPVERCVDLHRRCAQGDTFGCFKSELRFKPDVIRQPGQPDLRETASDFGYIDQYVTHWDVPAGFVTDGASIPRALQPLIGGSWDERYIRAAVLHDFYIRRITADPESVHRLFFHALLASGTAFDRAWIMYRAVKRYGPQWTAIDLEAYEKKRRENIARVEQENARARAEYERCLARHLDTLRAPAGEAQWVDCPLDDRHQFILDLVNIAREEAERTLDDYRAGRCRQIGEDQYDCTPPEPSTAGIQSQAGACHYPCGASVCCAKATEAECAARPGAPMFWAGDTCPW